jgi:hypothetical protein
VSTISGHDPVPERRGEPLQRLLFGGVYGTVLAATLASALEHDTGSPNPAYDALWILVASLASATAHGYAHAIAHRTAGRERVIAETLRSMLVEWPLIAAVLPTLAALMGAAAGWWSEDGGINTSLAINMAALFGWGLWAARVAGQGWPSACRVGGVDVLLGLCIVAVNILAH